MEMSFSKSNLPIYIIVCLCGIQLSDSTTGDMIFSISYKHQTVGAQDRGNSLWCYRCLTMDENSECSNFTGNNSTLAHKCLGDRRTCIVKRYSYTTSTENSTSVQRMWSIERNCTNRCEPGCITIGERTKLYACTSCCDTSFCNTDRGASVEAKSKLKIILLGPSLFLSLFLTK
ncbi:uncharacterized protein LOC142320983 [Lycorma delicatula]|uniref:uncharacterized protein LOC142320983 n=1 Tax=Lycorma delicatula TaxID=130591 RepID=UPI003F5167A3